MKHLFLLSILLISFLAHSQNTTTKPVPKPVAPKPNVSAYQAVKPVLRQGTLKNKTYYDWQKTMIKESYSSMSDGTLQGNHTLYFKSGKILQESVYDKGELRYAKMIDEFGNVLQVGTFGANCKVIFYNYKDETEPEEKKMYVACLFSAIDRYIINVEIFNEDGTINEKFNSNIKRSDVFNENGKIKKELIVNNDYLSTIDGLWLRGKDSIKIKYIDDGSCIITDDYNNNGKSYGFQYRDTGYGYCYNFGFRANF